MLADPRILILDEATSAIDTITEARLQAALVRLLEGRTSFVVAHRLSTIRNASQVLVLDHGRLIERGTHAQLLAQGGVYAGLYRHFASAVEGERTPAVMSRKIPSPLVELRRVRLTLGGRVVLRDATWTVRRGEGWLVTGPNGAGKTSLLRILAGIIWPDQGRKGGERIYHFGRRASASPIGLEGRVAWLSPETHQRFARLDSPILAGDVILTGFANTLLLTHRATPAQRAAARAVAQKLGVAQFWRRPFPELSQGQQRLVLLARALASKPALLVLDEFSDGLDRTARERVGAAIIRRLRAGTAVVVATHRAGDVLRGLTRHLALNAGAANEVPLPTKIGRGLKRVGTPLRGIRAHTKTSPTVEFISRLGFHRRSHAH